MGLFSSSLHNRFSLQDQQNAPEVSRPSHGSPSTSAQRGLSYAALLDSSLGHGLHGPLVRALESDSGLSLARVMDSRTRDALENRWGSAVLRQILGLAAQPETHASLRSLYRLGRHLEQVGCADLALLVYECLGKAPTLRFHPALQSKVRSALASMRGEGGLVDQLARHAPAFIQQVTSPTNLFGMAVGQGVFTWTRHFLLPSSLGAVRGLRAAAWFPRLRAGGMAACLETPVSWLASKGMQEYLTPGMQSWDGATNMEELRSLGLGMLVLRSVGFASHRASAAMLDTALATPSAWRATLVPRLSGVLHPLSSVGALTLSHALEESLGWKGETSFVKKIFESSALALQFSLSARILHTVAGNPWAHRHGQGEQVLRHWEQNHSLWGNWDMGALFGGMRGMMPEWALSGGLRMASVEPGPVRGDISVSALSMAAQKPIPGGTVGTDRAPLVSSIAIGDPRRSYLPRSGETSVDYARRLNECSRGATDGNQTQLALALESLLSDPQTESFGRQAIAQLKELNRHAQEGEGILVRDYELPGLDTKLTFLSLPTTFLPEAWSLFFAAQVVHRLRSSSQPANQVLEIGSGTGWLSIYLAKLGLAKYTVGVDITESAPVVSRINALINKVSNTEFFRSEGFSQVDSRWRADWVVACIPQIPQGGALSERALADYHSPIQNVMRPHGLDLIFQLLQEARQFLTPRGGVLFNLAGRPGVQVLQEMFHRAGYQPVFLNHNVLTQDPGTNIQPLADLETGYGVRFEFIDPNSGDIISAQKALGVPGRRHDQFLVEGIPYGRHWQGVATLGLPRQGNVRWGYTEHAGLEQASLRGPLRLQLEKDWGISIPESSLFMGPRPEVLVEGLVGILTTHGGKVFTLGVEDSLTSGLSRARPDLQGRIYRADNLSELKTAVEQGELKVGVLSLRREDILKSRRLLNILERGVEQGVRWILLEDFPFRDRSGQNPITKRMATNPLLAQGIVLVQDMRRRFNASDLPLSVALIQDPSLYRAITRYGEMAHSRVSGPTQEAYRLFFNYLESASQMGWQPPWFVKHFSWQQQPVHGALAALTPWSRSLGDHATFWDSPRQVARHAYAAEDVLDLSFGESEWVPTRGQAFPWEQIYRRAFTEDPNLLRSGASDAVLDFVRATRGVSYSPDELALGYGVQGLILETLRILKQESGGTPLEVIVPQGAYGLFYSTATLSGAQVKVLPTRQQNGYRVNPRELREALRAMPAGTRPVLLLNLPSNPAGQYYELNDLKAIAKCVKNYGGVLMLDGISGLLKIQDQRYVSGMEREMRQILGENMVLFGGLSKEFAMGGLRMGWALGQPSWMTPLRERKGLVPDALGLSASIDLLPRWEEHIPKHSDYLKVRYQKLTQFFSEKGIGFIPAEGGYSLLVDFKSLLGRYYVPPRTDGHLSHEGILITSENLRQLLRDYGGVQVNRPEWSRTPEHYRVVFAIDDIDLAITRFNQFFKRVR